MANSFDGADNRKRRSMKKVVAAVIGGVIAIVLALILHYYLTGMNKGLQGDQLETFASVIQAEKLEAVEVSVKDDDKLMGVYTDAQKQGVAIFVETVGYAGEDNPIQLLVGLNARGAVTGVALVEHSESEHIAPKVEDVAYLKSYVGVKGSADDVDTVTGATVSSTGIRAGVNHAFSVFEKIRGDIQLNAPDNRLQGDQLETFASVIQAEKLEPVEVSVKDDDKLIGVYTDAQKQGVAIFVETVGYAGEDNPIQLLVGLNARGAVTGVALVEHSESEHIAPKVEDAAYLKSYVGVKGSADGVDTVTGATVSSTGIRAGVNHAFSVFEQIRQEIQLNAPDNRLQGDQLETFASVIQAEKLQPVEVSVKDDDKLIGVYTDAQKQGVAIFVQTVGYAGEDEPIHLLVGLNTKGAVTGVTLVEHSESARIAPKIEDPAYLQSYVGVTGSAKGVDTVTGATVSSTGIRAGVNHAFSVFEQIQGEVFK